MPTGSGDRWADDYERGRPSYPREAVAVAAVPESSRVLDLGAGTGKLTRVLAEQFAAVVAVEPAPAMRRVLANVCGGVDVLAGTAEQIPLADASVDAVFVAEAFHHFDGPRAVAEVARVLRAAGALVLLWNLPAGPAEPPIDAVERLVAARGLTRERLGYDPLDLNATRWEAGEWRDAFAGSPFAPLRERRFRHEQRLDRGGVVALVASMGWVGDLPDPERLPLLETVRSLLGEHQYLRPWLTHVCWTHLDAAVD